MAYMASTPFPAASLPSKGGKNTTKHTHLLCSTFPGPRALLNTFDYDCNVPEDSDCNCPHDYGVPNNIYVCDRCNKTEWSDRLGSHLGLKTPESKHKLQSGCCRLNQIFNHPAIDRSVLLSRVRQVQDHSYSRDLIAGSFTRRNELNYLVIKSWLDYCQENHPQCNRAMTKLLVGFRAIDVRKMTVVALPEGEPFATLSYVWGAPRDDRQPWEDWAIGVSSASRTPREVIGTSGLPTSLPETIKDAIFVARILGYRYLWVDRYCIPQDDKSAKHSQIQLMSELYSESSLTIIAASGDDSDSGLPGVTSLREKNLYISINRRQFFVSNDVRDEVQGSKWHTRGWAYQEALLSRRRLVFTKTRTYFQCLEFHINEEISIPPETLCRDSQLRTRHDQVFPAVFGLLPQYNEDSNESSNAAQDMSHRLSEYLSRDLTFDSDTINAFSGILKQFNQPSFVGLFLPMRSALQDHSSAAPIEDLASMISWRSSGPLSTRRPHFPSWSWARWKRSTSWLEISALMWIQVSRLVQPLLGSASVWYENNPILSWGSESKTILAKSNMGIYPKYLTLSGWAFQLKVPRATNYDVISPPPPLTVVDPVSGSITIDSKIEMVGNGHGGQLKDSFAAFIVGYELVDPEDQNQWRNKGPAGEWVTFLFLALQWNGECFERCNTALARIHGLFTNIQGMWQPYIPGFPIRWVSVNIC